MKTPSEDQKRNEISNIKNKRGDETLINRQKNIIDKMNTKELKEQISLMLGNKKNAELIEYCEYRLDIINRDTAFVEMSEVEVGEV